VGGGQGLGKLPFPPLQGLEGGLHLAKVHQPLQMAARPGPPLLGAEEVGQGREEEGEEDLQDRGLGARTLV